MQGLLKLHLDKILFFRLGRDMQKYQDFSQTQTDTRISKGSDVSIRDVFSFLVDAKDPETGRLVSTTQRLYTDKSRFWLRDARADR